MYGSRGAYILMTSVWNAWIPGAYILMTSTHATSKRVWLSDKKMSKFYYAYEVREKTRNIALKPFPRIIKSFNQTSIFRSVSVQSD